MPTIEIKITLNGRQTKNRWVSALKSQGNKYSLKRPIILDKVQNFINFQIRMNLRKKI